MKKIKLNSRQILQEGTPKCPETIELQQILNIPQDGYFGKHTLQELKSKYQKQTISLNELSLMGVKVRSEIPEHEIWWMRIKE